MVQIALFGTSADPPTTGHQAILEWLATRFDEVAVWAADNPFKPKQTSLVHRQAMLTLLLESLRLHYPNVQMCPHLSNARSLHSVRLAQQQWPQGALTLVVGSDVLESLPNWYHVDELLGAIHLLIVPRPGFVVSTTDLGTLKRLGGRFTIAADFVGLDVSSSEYRQTKADEAMIPTIADYIRRQQLYTWATGSPSS